MSIAGLKRSLSLVRGQLRKKSGSPIEWFINRRMQKLGFYHFPIGSEPNFKIDPVIEKRIIDHMNKHQR